MSDGDVLAVPGEGDSPNDATEEVEDDKEGEWERWVTETSGDVKSEEDGERSSDTDEEGYFDYEKELKRQEQALMEKFGRIELEEAGESEGVPLTVNMIGPGLSNIGRPVDTTQLAYLTFEASSKDLSEVEELLPYNNLTTVILSDNKLRSLLPLKKMRNLKVLNVELNLIETLEDVPLEKFMWLQALNLAKNKLTVLDGIRPNILLYLQLANNYLDSVEYFTSEYFPNLLSLNLRGNKLTNLEGLDLPKLRQLFIAENYLNDLNGVNGCPSLETLHARQNRIKLLTIWPSMDKLDYVNLRDNMVQHFTETMNLENCPNLKTLVMTGNPIWSSERYKEEILASCISLKRLDRTILSQLEIAEARQRRTGRQNGMLPPLENDPAVIVNVIEEESEIIEE